MADPDQRRVELLAELAHLGPCLPGTLSTRHLRCGNPRCRCKADPPQLHGPYTYWTRKVAGRTIAQLLTSEQADRYQAWIENDRRLRAIVTELEALAVATAHNAEGWPPKPAPTGQRRR
ncbi:MAG: DUF6788 family protein [Solirubrobacteraceae bacterium]